MFKMIHFWSNIWNVQIYYLNFLLWWVLWFQDREQDLLLWTNDLTQIHFLQSFPKSKVHAQYKHIIHEATKHNISQATLQWILNSVQMMKRKLLAQQVWNKFLGIMQGIIKTKSFGNRTNVLRNILLIFSVATGSITGRFNGFVFWVSDCVLLSLRRTGSFFRMKQVHKVPLLEPRMRETVFCCWSVPVNERKKAQSSLLSHRECSQFSGSFLETTRPYLERQVNRTSCKPSIRMRGPSTGSTFTKVLRKYSVFLCRGLLMFKMGIPSVVRLNRLGD